MPTYPVSVRLKTEFLNMSIWEEKQVYYIIAIIDYMAIVTLERVLIYIYLKTFVEQFSV